MLKILISALLLSSGVAYAAGPVMSCDKEYTAEVLKPGFVTVTGRDGKSSRVRIGHHIDGGSFSRDDGYLVLYGIPAKTSPQTPQTNYLTLYRLGHQPKTVVRRDYGAGIYSADFSADGKFVAVTTRLGVDILDVTKITFESHDPAYTPQFPLQACDKQ